MSEVRACVRAGSIVGASGAYAAELWNVLPLDLQTAVCACSAVCHARVLCNRRQLFSDDDEASADNEERVGAAAIM